MITEERLKEIEARVAEAEAGPWVVTRTEIEHLEKQGRIGGIERPATGKCSGCDDGCPGCEETAVVITDAGYYPPDRPTAEFIAHARADVPDLAAEVRQLRAILLEHVHDGGYDGDSCIGCGRYFEDPHTSACAVAAALGLIARDTWTPSEIRRYPIGPNLDTDQWRRPGEALWAGGRRPNPNG